MAGWIVVHTRDHSLTIPVDRITRVIPTRTGSQLWMGRRDAADMINVKESYEEIARLINDQKRVSETIPDSIPGSGTDRR
jgi:hypothetical protein